MSGRIIACAVSVCVLCGLSAAGESGFPAAGRRPANQFFHYQSGGTAARLERPMPVWPPSSPKRGKRDVRPERPAMSRFPGDAFMVDTSVVPGPVFNANICFGAASNGAGFRVLWHDGNLFRTSGIGQDGSLHDGPGIVAGGLSSPTSVETREIAATGEGFIAVWTYGGAGIGGAVLDSTGVPLDSFLVFESDSGQAEPAVAFDGDSTCLVVWTESPNGDPDIYAARVTTSGQVLDTSPIAVADDTLPEMMPSVAYGQGVYLVAWTAATDAGGGARAVRVSRAGTVVDTAISLLHDSTMIQAYPVVTFGDTCFMTAWSEGLEQPDMFAARVSPSGTLIDSAVQLTDSPDYEMFASVGFDGTRYLAMWCDMDMASFSIAVCGRRLTADCAPLDSGMIRPSVPGYIPIYPGVAADRNNFLVGFTVEDTVAYADGVCCVRISPEGAVLDSGIFLPLGPDAQILPSAATDGADFLAAWLETRGSGRVVSAARISAGGTVLDPAGITVSTALGGMNRVAATFGDSVYLLAWAEHLGSESDVYCARVAMDGTVLDPAGILVCGDSLPREGAAASFDGQNFLVVWQDGRSQTDNDIYAARISPAGAVLDPGGFAVDISAKYDDVAPSVCHAGPNYLITWAGTDVSVREGDIFGALVTPDGGITEDRFVVCAATGDQSNPLVAAGPSCALVAWEDLRQYQPDIYAARVGADGTVLDTAGLVVAESEDDELGPCIAADADGFKVVWSRYSYMWDTTTFVAARVDTAGRVRNSGDWFAIPGMHGGAAAACGSGPDLLLLFSCFTDTAFGHDYGALRLWGRLGQVPGIEEAGSEQTGRVAGGASIVRGALNLQSAVYGPQSVIGLIDAAGRRAADLRPGTNDVSTLAPGVYFIRDAKTKSMVRRVVIAR